MGGTTEVEKGTEVLTGATEVEKGTEVGTEVTKADAMTQTELCWTKIVAEVNMAANIDKRSKDSLEKQNEWAFAKIKELEQEIEMLKGTEKKTTHIAEITEYQAKFSLRDKLGR